MVPSGKSVTGELLREVWREQNLSTDENEFKFDEVSTFTVYIHFIKFYSDDEYYASLRIENIELVTSRA